MPRPLSPSRSLVRLMEAAATPLYALDGERRVVFANAALGEWIGQSAEELTGLRCDYHAGGGEQVSSELGAALCPPPEAFLGQCERGQVGRPAAENRPHELRQARFLWLPGQLPEHGLLIVVVLPAEAPAPGPAGNQASPEQLHALLARLRGRMSRRHHLSQLLGESDIMRQVREQVRVAAAVRARVLVVGPRGSGREHVARAIHYAQPAAAIGPLVPIDCALIDAEELQAALTNVLRRQIESPTESPPAALLLNVDRLREGAQLELAGFFNLPEIELRTLATARRPLHKLIAKGRFRRDLACALSTLTIRLPPLAARREDLPLIAQHFLEETNAAGGKQLSGFSAAALELLSEYRWPQNLDELASTVRHACQRAAGLQVQPADLPEAIRLGIHAAAHPRRTEEPIDLEGLLAQIERELLARALRQARGNKSKAAELLGIHRARLLRRLVALGLAAPTPEEEPVVFEPVDDESP